MGIAKDGGLDRIKRRFWLFRVGPTWSKSTVISDGKSHSYRQNRVPRNSSTLLGPVAMIVVNDGRGSFEDIVAFANARQPVLGIVCVPRAALRSSTHEGLQTLAQGLKLRLIRSFLAIGENPIEKHRSRILHDAILDDGLLLDKKSRRVVRANDATHDLTVGVASLHLDRPILVVIDCRNHAAERNAGPTGGCIPSGTSVGTISGAFKSLRIESLDANFAAGFIVLKISPITVRRIRDAQASPGVVVGVNHF